MAGNIPRCTCKRCKKARRKGLILGTRRAIFWLVRNGKPELYDGPVSDYVPYHRWLPGRRKDKSLTTHSIMVSVRP